MQFDKQYFGITLLNLYFSLVGPTSRASHSHRHSVTEKTTLKNLLEVN